MDTTILELKAAIYDLNKEANKHQAAFNTLMQQAAQKEKEIEEALEKAAGAAQPEKGGEQ